jgi:hypothetical protein
VPFVPGRERYEPLLRAHPAWLEDLAAAMDERLERRVARLAAGPATRSGLPLIDRIRRNFFPALSGPTDVKEG